MKALSQHPKIRPDTKETLQFKSAELLYKLKRDQEAEAILEGISKSPQRGSKSWLDIARTRATHLSNQNNHSGAQAEIERVRTAMGVTENQVIRRLDELSGDLHVPAKNYRAAMDAYARACHQVMPGRTYYSPDASLSGRIQSLFNNSIVERRLEDARYIHTKMKDWLLKPVVLPIWLAEIEVTAGNRAAAQAALQQARDKLNEVYGKDRENANKRIQELEAKLPKP